jgi:hypothetical protein
VGDIRSRGRLERWDNHILLSGDLMSMASGYLEAEEAEGKELVQMRKQARRRESFIEPEGRSTTARKFFNLAAAHSEDHFDLLTWTLLA